MESLEDNIKFDKVESRRLILEDSDSPWANIPRELWL